MKASAHRGLLNIASQLNPMIKKFDSRRVLLLLCIISVSSFINPTVVTHFPRPSLSPCTKGGADDVPVDAPAVEGAQFFGGAAAKEVFVDGSEDIKYTRDDLDSSARVGVRRQSLFTDASASEIGLRVERALNDGAAGELSFAPSFSYDSPLSLDSSSNPLERVATANKFFRSLSVSILDGEVVRSPSSPPSDISTVDLRWSVGFNWPTFWSPRVSLSGVSRLKVSSSPTTTTVHEWTDRLSKISDDSSSSLLARVVPQLLPRFWDAYHVGMAPSSELRERHELNLSSFFPKPYKVYEVPATLALKTSITDKVGRSARLASVVPDVMFSNIIKTVGPSMEEYVPGEKSESALTPPPTPTTNTSLYRRCSSQPGLYRSR